jgi:hypothetical protein
MEVIFGGLPHIPIEAAAAELHTTSLRILMLIKRKVMAGCRIDGEWYVEKSSLACFRSYDADVSEGKSCSSCSGCKGK